MVDLTEEALTRLIDNGNRAIDREVARRLQCGPLADFELDRAEDSLGSVIHCTEELRCRGLFTLEQLCYTTPLRFLADDDLEVEEI